MKFKAVYIAAALALAAPEMRGGDTLQWNAGIRAQASTGAWAPWLIGSGDGGRNAMKNGIQLDATVAKDWDLTRRLSWTAGAEVLAGTQAGATYDRYDPGTQSWGTAPWHPARARVQQLWAGIKWRGVMLEAGMRTPRTFITDDGTLSTGDLVLSTNARPIPQVRAGFVNFQPIPLTRGWVEIMGSLAYGKFMDSDALEQRFNHWSGHIVRGQLFTYKELYLRTPLKHALSVTIGAQVGGAFGGTTTTLNMGQVTGTRSNPKGFKAFWDMLLPLQDNGNSFYEGSQLGTWDLKARYRIPTGDEFYGYFQWLWEDGSGMARRNNTDGLWGAGWTNSNQGSVITAALIEYIDFRDQSGSLHWAPGDHTGATITSQATGADDYYNNGTFNSWANYGLGIGSSFPVAPLYNSNGQVIFACNRTRGVNIGAMGNIAGGWTWRGRVAHAVGWGSGHIPSGEARKSTSALVSARGPLVHLPHGTLNAALTVAFDTGNLRPAGTGAMLTVSYAGALQLDK